MWVVRKKHRSNNIDGRIQGSFFTVLIVGALVLTLLILLPYISALFVALILSIVARPLYNYFHLRMHKTPAALLTVFLVILLIIIPLTVFGILLYNEVQGLYVDGKVVIFNEGWFARASERVNSFVTSFSPRFSFNLESFADQLVGWFGNNLSAFFSRFIDAVIGLFIAALGLFYLFRDGEQAAKRIMYLSPLADRYDAEILEKVEAAINSVVRGSLVVALIQGVLSGIGFTIFGLPHPVLWASIATLTSLIPSVGTAVVLVPSVLYLFFSGATGAAVGLLLWGSIAVGFIDNLLGPHLIERGIKIHPFLILLSVIGGIGFFGPVGFIAGPVVLSLLFTLLHIYPSILRAASHRTR